MNGCENTVTACMFKWVKYIYIGVECSGRCEAHCSVNVGLEKAGITTPQDTPAQCPQHLH